MAFCSEGPTTVFRNYAFWKLLLYPYCMFGHDKSAGLCIDERVSAVKLKGLQVACFSVASRGKYHRQKTRPIPHMCPNDEVERRGTAPVQNETDLYQSSIPS